MISGLSSNNLYSAQLAQQTSMARLSSAQRINSAKDDAAGAAISSSFTVQIRGAEQANRNLYDGLSLTNTASSGLGQISDQLQRARELAVQAGNGINSPSDTQALQSELNQLMQNVDQTAAGTQFNGQALLSGNTTTQIQSGSNPGDTQAITTSGATTSALGISGLNITNPANVSSVLQSLDNAIASVSSQSSNLGAVSSGLESNLEFNSAQSVATAEARSRIADADFAKESSNQAQASLRERVAMQAISLYNANQPNPLSFVK